MISQPLSFSATQVLTEVLGVLLLTISYHDQERHTVRLPSATPLGDSTITAELAKSIVTKWLSELEHLLSKRKYDSLKHLFREDSWLRDIQVFSWNLRTINGSARILDFLLQSTNDKELNSLSCKVSGHFQPSLRSVSSDLIALSGCSTSRRPWIEVLGLLRLVPGCSSHWKAFMVSFKL